MTDRCFEPYKNYASAIDTKQLDRLDQCLSTFFVMVHPFVFAQKPVHPNYVLALILLL